MAIWMSAIYYNYITLWSCTSIFLKESTTCASIAIISKQCRLVDVTKSTASRPQTSIDWELCVLCQDETAEPLQCPAVSKRQDAGVGYGSLSNNLMEFSELGELAHMWT